MACSGGAKRRRMSDFRNPAKDPMQSKQQEAGKGGQVLLFAMRPRPSAYNLATTFSIRSCPTLV